MLRSVELIAIDPRVGGGEACVEGSNSASVGSVLQELAAGRSVEEVAALYASTADRDAERPLSPEGVRAALAYAAVLAREEALPVRSAAGFAESLPAGVSLEQVRAHAAPVLGELAGGLSRDELFVHRPAMSADLLKSVLLYGRSLVGNDPLAVEREPAAETFLRDMLSEPDRQLVEELYLYRREMTGIYLQKPEPMFRLWQRVVEETEGGYVDYYEYANDLNARDDLEDWVAQISPTGKERWLELIAPLDKRFENATRHIARPVYDPEGKARRWFWYRVPVRMDQRTEAEFRGLGRL
jgi:uncharacterized protein (DUF433 family)